MPTLKKHYLKVKSKKKKSLSFEKLVYDKRVAIVGPSKSLCNTNMGHIIDKYDVVIRINRFEDIKKHADYGKKTTVLYYNFADKPTRSWNGLTLVKAAHPLKYKITCDYSNNKNYIQTRRKYRHLHFELYNYNRVCNYFGDVIRSLNFPTSGFWAILEIFSHLNQIKELGVFGIDFCLHSYIDGYHQKQDITNTHHSFLKERQWFHYIWKYTLPFEHKKKIIIYDNVFKAYVEKKITFKIPYNEYMYHYDTLKCVFLNKTVKGKPKQQRITERIYTNVGNKAETTDVYRMVNNHGLCTNILKVIDSCNVKSDRHTCMYKKLAYIYSTIPDKCLKYMYNVNCVLTNNIHDFYIMTTCNGGNGSPVTWTKTDKDKVSQNSIRSRKKMVREHFTQSTPLFYTIIYNQGQYSHFFKNISLALGVFFYHLNFDTGLLHADIVNGNNGTIGITFIHNIMLMKIKHKINETHIINNIHFNIHFRSYIPVVIDFDESSSFRTSNIKKHNKLTNYLHHLNLEMKDYSESVHIIYVLFRMCIGTLNYTKRNKLKKHFHIEYMNAYHKIKEKHLSTKLSVVHFLKDMHDTQFDYFWNKYVSK